MGLGDRSAERIGEVAEWSIAAGCKPAALAATEVRTLPSPPAFARVETRAGFGSASQRRSRGQDPPVCPVDVSTERESAGVTQW